MKLSFWKAQATALFILTATAHGQNLLRETMPPTVAATAVVPVVIIDAQGNPTFQNDVLGCFERFKAAGGETADLMEALHKPSPQAKNHTIRPSAARVNSTSFAKTGKRQPSGNSGGGSDTNIAWNPNNRDPYIDGTPRDPCASLLHEMRHALDADKGNFDEREGAPAPQPGTGIEQSEIDGCREENRYRLSQQPPLPARTQYGTNKLPDSAIRPR